MTEPLEKRIRAGVMGATGRLGSLIVEEAFNIGFDVTEIPRGNEAVRQAALERCDVAIISAPQDSDSIYRSALEAGCHIVDVGIHEETIRSALVLDDLIRDRGLKYIMMAGLAPGLSGMVGLGLADRYPSAEKVDVVLLQNSKGTAGKRGVCDMLDMLTDVDLSMPVDLGDSTNHLSESKSGIAFPLPTPERNLLPIDASGPEIRYFTLFDSHSMNRMIQLLRTFRMRSRSAYRVIRNLIASIKSKQAPPNTEKICLSAIAIDEEGSVLGRADLALESDYGATAQIAVAMAGVALRGDSSPGVGHPSRFTDWRELVEMVFPDTKQELA